VAPHRRCALPGEAPSFDRVLPLDCRPSRFRPRRSTPACMNLWQCPWPRRASRVVAHVPVIVLSRIAPGMRRRPCNRNARKGCRTTKGIGDAGSGGEAVPPARGTGGARGSRCRRPHRPRLCPRWSRDATATDALAPNRIDRRSARRGGPAVAGPVLRLLLDARSNRSRSTSPRSFRGTTLSYPEGVGARRAIYGPTTRHIFGPERMHVSHRFAFSGPRAESGARSQNVSCGIRNW